MKSLVTKISVSDVNRSVNFFTKVLKFKVVPRYTINKGGNFGDQSYVQLKSKRGITIGLFKDISKPYNPKPETGTVPSFIVKNIKKTLKRLQKNDVTIDEFDGSIILSNVSDDGYEDRFFFFRDPDNNSFVMRQNMGKENKT